jgi:hypothetical protein
MNLVEIINIIISIYEKAIQTLDIYKKYVLWKLTTFNE